MTQEQFIKRLEELYKSNLEISRAKNKDYAGEADPFKNFKLCEMLGVCSVEEGMLVRITDKLSRISNLLKKEAEVKDESVLDTLQDLSNYSMIMRIYLEENKK